MENRTLYIDAIRSLQPSHRWQRENARFVYALGSMVPINPMIGASEEWRWDVSAFAQLNADEIIRVYTSLKDDDGTRHYDTDRVS